MKSADHGATLHRLYEAPSPMGYTGGAAPRIQVRERDTSLNVTIGVEPTFDFLSAEYRTLFSPGRGTAFQAPLWLDHLHRRLGPALVARQHTITVRDALSRDLIAVLPMVVQRSRGVTIIQPADFGICDYNSIVGDPLRLIQLSANGEVKAALRRTMAGADIVMFRKARIDEFDPALLLGTQSSTGENVSHICEIGLDPDVWRLNILRRKFTKELGRLQRQTEREHGSYEHRIATDAVEIAEAFDYLREAQCALRTNTFLGKDSYFSFYRDYAIESAASGESRTYVSRIAGKIVAVLFGLAGDGIFHAMLIGSDRDEFERISPGIQLIYRIGLMQMAEGHDRLDLGPGNPGYKDHFRPTLLEMRNHTLSLTPAGAAVSLIYHRIKPLKNLLRGLATDVR